MIWWNSGMAHGLRYRAFGGQEKIHHFLHGITRLGQGAQGF
jgi:hypothetical protein